MEVGGAGAARRAQRPQTARHRAGVGHRDGCPSKALVVSHTTARTARGAVLVLVPVLRQVGGGVLCGVHCEGGRGCLHPNSLPTALRGSLAGRRRWYSASRAKHPRLHVWPLLCVGPQRCYALPTGPPLCGGRRGRQGPGIGTPGPTWGFLRLWVVCHSLVQPPPPQCATVSRGGGDPHQVTPPPPPRIRVLTERQVLRRLVFPKRFEPSRGLPGGGGGGLKRGVHKALRERPRPVMPNQSCTA